jgi:hypothetical protein
MENKNNPDKVIASYIHHETHCPQVNINNIRIPVQTETKYLG